MAPPTTTVKPTTALKPFTVEFGDDHCRNFHLSSIKQRVRGRWSVIVLASRPQGPGDPGKLGGMPPLPGQRLEMTPADNSIRIFDPLEDQQDTLKRATVVAQNALLKSKVRDKGTYLPIEEVRKDLDPDKFKTLLIEIRRMLFPGQGGEVKATLVSGKVPTVEDIEKMEGHELYDMNNSNWDKPKYRKDSEAWRKDKDRL